jgi:hypothetical protein
VNYSGATPGKPEAAELELIHPGAPDSPVLQTRAHSEFPFCSFLLKSNLFFLLVCVELLAPVECII